MSQSTKEVFIKVLRYAYLGMMLWLPFQGSSQTIGEDVVVLTNGNKIRGTIVEQAPGRHLSILLQPANDTLTIPMDSIDRLLRIVENDFDPAKAKSDNSKEIKNYNTRQINFLLNGAVGSGDLYVQSLGFSILYRVNSKLQLGGALNYYGNAGTRREYWGQYLPLTANIRYELSNSPKGRAAFLSHLNMGYNILINSSYTDDQMQQVKWTNGFYVQPGLGFRWNVGREVGLIMGVSYQYFNTRKIIEANKELIKSRNRSNIILSGSIFF